MSEEEAPDKRLKRLTGATDLSTAIEKLEKKKTEIEDDFKEEAHYFFENLNPISVLDKTLQNLNETSLSKYSLFNEALAFGAGHLSKKKLIKEFKSALIKTFRIKAKIATRKAVAVKENQDEKKPDEPKQTDKKYKEMNLQDQSEKVKAKPEVLPEPTYWPFFLAMGISFLGWGLLTTWLFSLVGLIIMIVSLTGWINILRHE